MIGGSNRQDRVSLFLAEAEMAYGEQAALIGVLSALKPQVSLELGTFRGGSLAHIAAHSREVHTFDLASHTAEVLPNVCYHLGDTRTTVPPLLRQFEEGSRNIDFVFVDADHSRAGVQRDMSNLLTSRAMARTVILVHDCANEAVREGTRNAVLAARDIAYADLSFVRTTSSPSLLGEQWGGLGIVVIDREGDLWRLKPQVVEDVLRRTSDHRSLLRDALAPARAGKRGLAYRARPLYRRLRGSRGVRLH
jgi:hypothetical protein